MAGMELLGYHDTYQAFEQLRDFATELRDTVYITGTNVEYSVYVEFGTSRMQAQPFLFPAARRVIRNPEQYIGTPESGEALVREIALAIEREATKDAPVDTGRLQNSIEAERVA